MPTTSATSSSLLDRKLAEAREAEHVHRALAERYQGWLEGRRFLVFSPDPDGVRLAEVLRAFDALVVASARLARVVRRTAERNELPPDLREELRACADNPALWPKKPEPAVLEEAS